MKAHTEPSSDLPAPEETGQPAWRGEQLLLAISDASSDVIFVKDREGRMRFANPAALALIGKPLEKVLGRTDLEFLDDKQAARQVMEHDRVVMQSGTAATLEEHVPLPDGTERVWLSHKSPYRDADGCIIGLLGISRDITERKRAEDALRASDMRFRLALHSAPVSLAAQDRNLKYIWAHNQETAPAGGIIGRGDGEIFTPEETDHITAMKRRVLEEGVMLREQMWFARPGGPIFLDVSWAPLLDDAGSIVGVTSATVDLTAQKLAEDALRLSEQKFAKAFRGSTSAMSISRLHDGVFIDVNDRYLEVAGFARDEVIGRSSGDLGIWARPDERAAFVRALQDHGAIRTTEYLFRRRDGTEWTGLVSAELSEIAGEPVIISSTADITERKRQERRVQELTRLYAVLSKVNEAIVRTRDPRVLYEDACRIVAEEGRHPLVWVGLVEGRTVKPVAFAGRAADYMRQLKVETDGPFGQGPSGTCIREARAVVNDDFGTNPSTEPWREAALKHELRASASFPIRHRGAVIGSLTLYASEPGTFDEEQVQLLDALSADVSYALDKLWQEQALHESEQRFRALADDSPVPIWVTDTAGRVEFVNRAYTEFFGASMQEVQSDGWQPLIHPEDAPVYVGAFMAALVGRTSFRAQTRVRHADGGWRWIDSHGIARFSASGEFLGIAGSSPDITERMELERRLQENAAKLEEANRLKDDFLATLSHELRTPMSAIVGWAQVLSTRKADAATLDRGLQAIVRNSEAQLQLITDILDVSRIVSGRLRLNVGPIDLAAVVYAAVDTVRTAVEAKGIDLTVEISTTATVVQGDADRLQQVVWNLLSNSVKFTPPGGWVRVSLQRGHSHLALRVQDAGMGINAKFLPHVFERFSQEDTSTTRRHGGLGLGLSIVRHLVELHGGTVEAESEGEGRGSIFTVRLPIRAVARTDTAGKQVQGSEAPTGATAIAGLAGVRVLVVDDEADARELIRTVLTEFGATVQVAASAAEGLASLLEEPFDVLVTDVGMPGEDGYDFVRKLRALPDESLRAIPAVALTAYGRSDDAARALASGFQVHLTKPVAPDALASTIAQCVAGFETT